MSTSPLDHVAADRLLLTRPSLHHLPSAAAASAPHPSSVTSHVLQHTDTSSSISTALLPWHRRAPWWCQALCLVAVCGCTVLLQRHRRRRRQRKLEQQHRDTLQQYATKCESRVHEPAFHSPRALLTLLLVLPLLSCASVGTSVRFGLDIGGTLCKLVYFEPDEVDESARVSKAKVDAFIKGSTQYGLTGNRDDQLAFHQQKIHGTLHFLKFQTSQMTNFVRIVQTHDLTPQSRSHLLHHSPSMKPHHMQQHAASGQQHTAAAASTDSYHLLDSNSPLLSGTHAPLQSTPKHLHSLVSSSASVLSFATAGATTSHSLQSAHSSHSSTHLRSGSNSSTAPQTSTVLCEAVAPLTHKHSTTPAWQQQTHLRSVSTNPSSLVSSVSPALVSQSDVSGQSCLPELAHSLHHEAHLAQPQQHSPVVLPPPVRQQLQRQRSASDALPAAQTSAAAADSTSPAVSSTSSARQPRSAAASSSNGHASTTSALNAPSWLAAFPATCPPFSPPVCATGGGAYKFASLFASQLGVDLFITDELESLVRGIDFLIHQQPNECYYLDQFRFRLPLREASYGAVQYPYLVVNIGSGVSILKVSGPNAFERVGGTSLGGGTFYGLARALCGCTSFEEALSMAELGHSQCVDLLVGDIYGGNYSQLGLSKDNIASSFGKLVRSDALQQANKHDLAKALLIMITNNIGSLANLYAHKVLHVPQIIFVGNFLTHNDIAKRGLAFATDFWSHQTAKALFLRHEGYFGAVGSMLFE